jgi:hypothetical protein
VWRGSGSNCPLKSILVDDERLFILVKRFRHLAHIRLEASDDAHKVARDLGTADFWLLTGFFENEGHQLALGKGRSGRDVPDLDQSLIIFGQGDQADGHVIYIGVGVGEIDVAQNVDCLAFQGRTCRPSGR